ncbi:hypothetical protein MJ575_18295 [Klebsiella pneumoniae]|nr:hypothetical protein MJ575_18295 [Klebsiella pneumoniae]
MPTSIIQHTRLGRICRSHPAGPAHGGDPWHQYRPGDLLVSFVIGAAMAGLAGVLVTANYGTFDFYIGFIIGHQAFTAAVLGGIGSLPGAMLRSAAWGGRSPVRRAGEFRDYKDVFPCAAGGDPDFHSAGAAGTSAGGPRSKECF